jgi:hypothetical protein
MFDELFEQFLSEKHYPVTSLRRRSVHQPSPSAPAAEASILLTSNSNRFLASSDLTLEISIAYSQRTNKRWDSSASGRPINHQFGHKNCVDAFLIEEYTSLTSRLVW